MLNGMADGTFLVRESDSRQGAYSLSVIYADKVKHLKIIQQGVKYKIAPDGMEFDSVQDLIAFFRQHSLKRHFPHLPLRLAIPYRSALLSSSAPHLPGAAEVSVTMPDCLLDTHVVVWCRITGLGRARAKFDCRYLPIGLSTGYNDSLFPDAPQDPDELSLHKGQELVILTMDEQDKGWWRCRKPDGEVCLELAITH
jgi:hypothetical protein